MVVIGVHTPEFNFEKNVDNVRREVKALRVDYPVAVDSEYVIWRAFNNNYWPAQYFIDAQGRVRHRISVRAPTTNRKWSFSACSPEAGAGGIGDDLISVARTVSNWVADWASLKSPENYAGSKHTEGFASPFGD